MLKDITLGQFFPGNSCVHRLDPRVKLVLMVAYIVLVFLVSRRNTRAAQHSVRQYMERYTGGMDSARSSNMLYTPLAMMVFDPYSGDILWTNDNFLQLAEGCLCHIIVRNILAGEHAVERTVFIGHRNRCIAALFLQCFPSAAHCYRCAQQGRCIVHQIADLCVHIGDMLGRLESKAIQHQLGFVRDTTQTGSSVFPITTSVTQSRICHCRNDRVRIRVSVSGYINWIHPYSPPFSLIVISPARFRAKSASISFWSMPWPIAHMSLVMAASVVISRP